VKEQILPPSGSRGRLITFEGIDKCGKSTQADLLCNALLAHGVAVGSAGAPGLVVREPGGTAIGEQVRDLLLHSGGELAPRTEALLYAAARAELVATVLRPSLAAGWVVILDRYVDSTLAYQGCARGLGIDAMLDLNDLATGGLLPDLTFLVTLSPAEAAGRKTGPPDRIEREGLMFQERVAEGYRDVAEHFPERIVVVDGARPAELIAAQVFALALQCVKGGHV
jgi:dTMP kinase